MDIQEDQFFMQAALAQAALAAQQDEVPVGAVIVGPDGTLIATAYNQTEQLHTQAAHAEMLALAAAGNARGDWRLDDCWIYVTLEPCAMCMHAIALSRIAGVVYGAASPLYGYQLDKYGRFSLYQWPMIIKVGVCADEAAQILKVFFKKRRKRGKGDQS
ncbi:MAG: nucleoside deaminase [Candidatus Babeliales bacterium]